MPVFDAQKLAQWSGGVWQGTPPSTFNGVSTDTRALGPGSVFLAIRGERCDAHDFLAMAKDRGALGAVVSRSMDPGAVGLPLLRVADTGQALRALAAAWRREVGLHVVAITGSVGKTSAKEMAADVLACLGPTARTRGNWNNEYGLPLSLLQIEPDQRIGVFEVGMSHPGELAPLCRLLQPDVGVITTIGPVHIEFFDDVAAIAREKAELLAALPPNGLAVLRRDEPYYELLRRTAPCPALTVALNGAADYRAVPESGADGRVGVEETASGERCVYRPAVPGRHMEANALFAIALGRRQGLDWAPIREALEAYQPPPMRWERCSVADRIVINDAYNANPLSMAAALNTFAALPATGRKWVVLAGMLELGALEASAHRDLGRLAAQGPWAGLLTVGRLGDHIANAARDAGLPEARRVCCPTHVEAAQALADRTRKGDLVLLKASRGQKLERVLEAWRNLAGD